MFRERLGNSVEVGRLVPHLSNRCNSHYTWHRLSRHCRLRLRKQSVKQAGCQQSWKFRS